jgi:uncharacterized membrane protein YkvA (DUF1232 family)
VDCEGIAFSSVAYALSPIDLIPDFVPILGYLDDLILVPAGLALALRMIPVEVIKEARKMAAQAEGSGKGIGWIAAGVILLIWILAIIGVASLVLHLKKKL